MANRDLDAWVADVAGHTKPAAIHGCDGSRGEADTPTNRMLADGTLESLDDARHPRSYLHRSHGSDVARTEELTFICSKRRDDAGPTKLYVVPYLMGPRGSMAMLPFCGYHMGDYFGHWLSMGRRLVTPPRIFHVNWFRTGDDGKMLWPGFGEDARVLEWILERVAGRAPARATPIGDLPVPGGLDVRGLELSQADVDALLTVDPQSWLAEVEHNEAFFRTLGDRLPAALAGEQRALRDRLRASIS